MSTALLELCNSTTPFTSRLFEEHNNEGKRRNGLGSRDTPNPFDVERPLLGIVSASMATNGWAAGNMDDMFDDFFDDMDMDIMVDIHGAIDV